MKYRLCDLKVYLPFTNLFILIPATHECLSDNTLIIVYIDTIVFSFLSSCRDLCSVFGADMLQLVETDPIGNLLIQGRRSKTSKTKTLAMWATKEIRRLKSNNSTWWVQRFR